jgi:hypothetical protein
MDMTASIELDPRWQWIEGPRRLSESEAPLIRGKCNHLEVIEVESGGETVAHLCLTCDSQLP